MNYEIKPGTLFETFDTIGDWTSSGTAGGVSSVDTTIFEEGVGSLKLASNASASSNWYATKTINADLSSAGIISFGVYIEDASKLSGLTFYLSSQADFSKYFSKSLTLTPLKNGWNTLRFSKNLWGATGGEVWSNTMIRLRVRIDSTSSGGGVVYFDNMKYGTYHRPKIVWTCDDGWIEQYSELFAYMNPRGLRATCYIPHSTIGSGNYMTEAILRTVYDAGWDIANHSYGHTNLTTLATQAEMQAEVSKNRAYIESLGFARNNMQNHYCYANGGFNDTALLALEAEGVLSARTVKAYQGLGVTTPVDQPLLMLTRNLGNTTTLASAILDVDYAVASGTTLIFESHRFLTPATSSIEFPVEDMKSLVDYIYKLQQGNVLDVVTISEWYEGLTNPRKKI